MPAHDECALGAQLPERLCKHRTELLAEDAEDHPPRLSRVDQRSEHVEDCSEGELLADRCESAKGGVVERGEEEGEGRGGR